MNRSHLLPLNLQLFAQDPQEPPEPPADPPADPPPLDQDERQELIQLRKTAAIHAAGISEPQDVANLQTHLEGLETAADISGKINAILADLKLARFQQAGDPNPGNHMRRDPEPVNHYENGRKLFHQIQNRHKRI